MSAAPIPHAYTVPNPMKRPYEGDDIARSSKQIRPSTASSLSSSRTSRSTTDRTYRSTNRNAATARTKVEEPIDDADGHMKIQIGRFLGTRYEILALRGEGTFGKVVECLDRQEQCKVAVKVIRAVSQYRDAAMTEIAVLRKLQDGDPANAKGCIFLKEWFEYRNHICMVFELLGKSIFDFLKDNQYIPFPMQQIHSFAQQLIKSVAFLHENRLIHTDLKPENILLMDSSYCLVPSQVSPTGDSRSLLHTNIKLIDFGSTVFQKERHTNIVCTRHYRAPEIILGLGWSFPCDLWSVGCVLVELFSGEVLFQTHDNVEHLAMMEKVFGPMPLSMQRGEGASKFFRSGKLLWPDSTTTPKSEKRVGRMKPLKTALKHNAHDPIQVAFMDLLEHLLVYDPNQRLTANEALQHPFINTNWFNSSSAPSAATPRKRFTEAPSTEQTGNS